MGNGNAPFLGGKRKRNGNEEQQQKERNVRMTKTKPNQVQEKEHGAGPKSGRRRINSRAKGARGERQWRDEIRAAGWQAERGQQFAGGAWSPDVRTDLPFHFEVKCVEKLNMDNAIAQAERDSANGNKPWAVAHKKNGGDWHVTISAETFFNLCREAGR